MWSGPLLGLVGLVILGAVAYALLRGRDGGTPRASADAHAILDERYARGEIDAEEYRSRVAGLYADRGGQ